MHLYIWLRPIGVACVQRGSQHGAPEGGVTDGWSWERDRGGAGKLQRCVGAGAIITDADAAPHALRSAIQASLLCHRKHRCQIKHAQVPHSWCAPACTGQLWYQHIQNQWYILPSLSVASAALPLLPVESNSPMGCVAESCLWAAATGLAPYFPSEMGR